MKKLISFLAVVLLAVSFAFAGGSAEQATTSESSDVVTTISNPITIEFWHSFSGDVQLPVIEGLVKEFNDTVGKEKGITVVPVAQGSGPQLYSKVIGAIKAGDVPAVAMTKVIYNEDYVTADASGLPAYKTLIMENLRGRCGALPAERVAKEREAG